MSASLQSLMRDRPVAGDDGASLLVQLVSFLAVGGATALLFIFVSAAIVQRYDSLPAWLVSSLCWAAFIVPVYLLHRRFSFRSRAAHRRALPRYFAVQLANLLLAALFSWVAYGAAGLPPLAAATLVSVLTSGVSFLVLRRWAFAGA